MMNKRHALELFLEDLDIVIEDAHAAGESTNQAANREWVKWLEQLYEFGEISSEQVDTWIHHNPIITLWV